MRRITTPLPKRNPLPKRQKSVSSASVKPARRIRLSGLVQRQHRPARKRAQRRLTRQCRRPARKGRQAEESTAPNNGVHRCRPNSTRQTSVRLMPDRGPSFLLLWELLDIYCCTATEHRRRYRRFWPLRVDLTILDGSSRIRRYSRPVSSSGTGSYSGSRRSRPSPARKTTTATMAAGTTNWWAGRKTSMLPQQLHSSAI